MELVVLALLLAKEIHICAVLARALILLIRKILIIARPALKLIRRLVSAVEVVIHFRSIYFNLIT